MEYIKTTRIDPVIIMLSSFLVIIVRSVHRKCVARQCIPYILVRQNKYYMKCKTMCLWFLILMFKISDHMDRLVDESFVLLLAACVPPPLVWTQSWSKQSPHMIKENTYLSACFENPWVFIAKASGKHVSSRVICPLPNKNDLRITWQFVSTLCRSHDVSGMYWFSSSFELSCSRTATHAYWLCER